MANIYRRAITITNDVGSNLTDFQIYIQNFDTASLVTAGKMRSDLGDIRFYDSDEVTELSHWVLPETKNTSTTSIFVKVPSILTTGKTIYMEYGDLSLSSVANISNTMIAGDDFDDNSMARMTVESGSWSVANGILSQTNTGINTNYTIKPNTNPSHTDVVIEARVRMTAKNAGGTDPLAGVIVRNNDTTGGVDNSGYVGQFGDIGGVEKVDIERFGSAHISNANFDYALNTWYRLSLMSVSTTLRAYINGSLIVTTTDSNYSSGKALLRTYSCRADFDWFIVRKAVSTTLNEPEISVGSEENLLATITTTSPAGSIDSNSATGGGDVTDDGGGTVTERGIVWGTSTNPTTAGNKQADAIGGTGTFGPLNMTGLLPDTHYYYRAYAINEAGTSYGANVEFDTLDAVISGTCTLAGSPVAGAIITLIRSDTDTVVATDTSDVSGNYSFNGLDVTKTYHVVAEYEDSPDQYNAKSLPFMTPEEI